MKNKLALFIKIQSWGNIKKPKDQGLTLDHSIPLS